MRGRRLLWTGLGLALAAALSQLLLWWITPKATVQAFTGPPRSGYTLENFSLDVLDKQGRLSMRIRAPHLERREADHSLYINAPRFLLPGNDGADWHGRSAYGWVSADGDLLKLTGKVDLDRPRSGPVEHAEIHTADVSVWPRENRLQTAAETRIQQPGRILHGTGMKADLNTHRLELLADVHGDFKPKH